MNKKIKFVLIFFICSISCIQIKNKEINAFAKQTVFIMGDSKSCYYPKSQIPKEGWTQEFVNMLDSKTGLTVQHLEAYKKYANVIRYEFDQYQIENWSVSGTSCTTAYKSKLFSTMLDQVNPKDYVIIALQHNDARNRVGESATKYKEYLRMFAEKIQKKKAKVVFMTTTPKNYLKDKNIKMHSPEYRNIMLKVAKEKNCQCIDLAKISTDYFNFRNRNYVNSLYLKLPAGKYPAWKDGVDDNSHYTEKGAKVVAQMIAVDIQFKHKIKIFKFKKNTNSLFRVYKKACSYKNKRNYTKKSWKNMIKQRNNAWKVLYTPNSTNQQCKTAQHMLINALRKLKKLK